MEHLNYYLFTYGPIFKLGESTRGKEYYFMDYPVMIDSCDAYQLLVKSINPGFLVDFTVVFTYYEGECAMGIQNDMVLTDNEILRLNAQNFKLKYFDNGRYHYYNMKLNARRITLKNIINE